MLPAAKDMTVILCGNKRLLITCWAACFILNGLQAQSADTDIQENMYLNQNFQSEAKINGFNDREYKIKECHQNCYKRYLIPGYCDLSRPALKHCKQFQTECQKTHLSNKIKFDLFADTKVTCKYYRYMISSCSFDNVSTNDNSTLPQDSLEKKRELKNENSDINEIRAFYDKLKTMAPVTDLYTGFTYVNEEIYKLHAENRSEPTFWNIRLSLNRDKGIYLFDGLNKCLNTTYFHLMNISFSYLHKNTLPSCNFQEESGLFLVDLWLDNNELTLEYGGNYIYHDPIRWSRIQCNLLKNAYQEVLTSRIGNYFLYFKVRSYKTERDVESMNTHVYYALCNKNALSRCVPQFTSELFDFFDADTSNPYNIFKNRNRNLAIS
ncbi:hypothetical protein BgiMline_012319 [Biomphalaria glabrata]